MAVTVSQVNARKATIVGRAFIRYPKMRAPLIRMAIQLHKNGTAQDKECIKAILREAYQAVHGVDPVGVHQFIHWVRDEPLADDPGDPTTGVGAGDEFAAEAITVT